MPRTKMVNRRPTLRATVEWIAHEDDAGGGANLLDVATYVTTTMAADMFGASRAHLAMMICQERARVGLPVGTMDEAQNREFLEMQRDQWRSATD